GRVPPVLAPAVLHGLQGGCREAPTRAEERGLIGCAPLAVRGARARGRETRAEGRGALLGGVPTRAGARLTPPHPHAPCSPSRAGDAPRRRPGDRTLCGAAVWRGGVARGRMWTRGGPGVDRRVGGAARGRNPLAG